MSFSTCHRRSMMDSRWVVGFRSPGADLLQACPKKIRTNQWPSWATRRFHFWRIERFVGLQASFEENIRLFPPSETQQYPPKKGLGGKRSGLEPRGIWTVSFFSRVGPLRYLLRFTFILCVFWPVGVGARLGVGIFLIGCTFIIFAEFRGRLMIGTDRCLMFFAV